MQRNQRTRRPSTLVSEVFAGESQDAVTLHRGVATGEIRRIMRGLYTSNMTDTLEAIVARNLWRVVDLVAPGTVVAGRTAFEMRPTDGRIFLVGPGRNEIRLPGVQLRIAKGPGPLPGDSPLMSHLYLASRPRALLDCLMPSRARGGVSRALPREAIEEYLDRELRVSGEGRLNQLRDEARTLAPLLGAKTAFTRLEEMVGTLLGTGSARLTAPVAIARAAGDPYDPQRLELFQTLHAALVQWPIQPRPDVLPTDQAFANAAFFDTYFSNFIEGTRFKVEEAHDIVFAGKIPSVRPRDAHDVLGTFGIVGNRVAMRQGVRDIATTAEFIDRVAAAHAIAFIERPDKRPGQFKLEANQAGQTTFVDPELVRATLSLGIDLARGLEAPFARAAMMMFVLAEVHPFDDGNGRMARAFMNAELIAGGQCRILIPIVFRDEYLAGLRTLSRQRHPDVFLKVLDYAHEYTWRIDFSDYDRALAMLTATEAFEEAEGGGRLLIAEGAERPDPKLRLPPPRATER